jgi:hypothetical protein
LFATKKIPYQTPHVIILSNPLQTGKLKMKILTNVSAIKLADNSQKIIISNAPKDD